MVHHLRTPTKNSLVSIRYGLALNSDGAEGAFLADAWTGSFSKNEGADIRRPGLFHCSISSFFNVFSQGLATSWLTYSFQIFQTSQHKVETYKKFAQLFLRPGKVGLADRPPGDSSTEATRWVVQPRPAGGSAAWSPAQTNA